MQDYLLDNMGETQSDGRKDAFIFVGYLNAHHITKGGLIQSQTLIRRALQPLIKQIYLTMNNL